VGSEFLVVGQVGRGAYGKVYEAEAPSEESVAVKVVDGIFNSTTDAKRTLRELAILRQCDHPNIIRCLTVLAPPASQRPRFTHLWIVLELCKTDLGKLLKNQRTKLVWSQEYVQLIMGQLLRGLGYLHSANIVHRDIKPAVSGTFTVLVIANYVA
jgi:serine/threonine protein kinase